MRLLSRTGRSSGSRSRGGRSRSFGSRSRSRSRTRANTWLKQQQPVSSSEDEEDDIYDEPSKPSSVYLEPEPEPTPPMQAEPEYPKREKYADLHQYDGFPVIDRVPTAVGWNSEDSGDVMEDERSRYSRYTVDHVSAKQEKRMRDALLRLDNKETFDDENEDKYNQFVRAPTKSAWSDSTDSCPPQWRSWDEEDGADWYPETAKDESRQEESTGRRQRDKDQRRRESDAAKKKKKRKSASRRNSFPTDGSVSVRSNASSISTRISSKKKAMDKRRGRREDDFDVSTKPSTAYSSVASANSSTVSLKSELTRDTRKSVVHFQEAPTVYEDNDDEKSKKASKKKKTKEMTETKPSADEETVQTEAEKGEVEAVMVDLNDPDKIVTEPALVTCLRDNYCGAMASVVMAGIRGADYIACHERLSFLDCHIGTKTDPLLTAEDTKSVVSGTSTVKEVKDKGLELEDPDKKEKEDTEKKQGTTDEEKKKKKEASPVERMPSALKKKKNVDKKLAVSSDLESQPDSEIQREARAKRKAEKKEKEMKRKKAREAREAKEAKRRAVEKAAAEKERKRKSKKKAEEEQQDDEEDSRKLAKKEKKLQKERKERAEEAAKKREKEEEKAIEKDEEEELESRNEEEEEDVEEVDGRVVKEVKSLTLDADEDENTAARAENEAAAIIDASLRSREDMISITTIEIPTLKLKYKDDIPKGDMSILGLAKPSKKQHMKRRLRLFAQKAVQEVKEMPAPPNKQQQQPPPQGGFIGRFLARKKHRRR